MGLTTVRTRAVWICWRRFIWDFRRLSCSNLQ